MIELFIIIHKVCTNIIHAYNRVSYAIYVYFFHLLFIAIIHEVRTEIL